jgi:putative peptide zinc metalloprotease protein
LDVVRIKPGTPGVFVPDDVTEPTVIVTVAEIATSGAASIEHPALCDRHGGPITTGSDRERGLVPTSAHYPLRLTASVSATQGRRSLRGVALLHGERESIAFGLWRRTAAIFIRESGF